MSVDSQQSSPVAQRGTQAQAEKAPQNVAKPAAVLNAPTVVAQPLSNPLTPPKGLPPSGPPPKSAAQPPVADATMQPAVQPYQQNAATLQSQPGTAQARPPIPRAPVPYARRRPPKAAVSITPAAALNVAIDSKFMPLAHKIQENASTSQIASLLQQKNYKEAHALTKDDTYTITANDFNAINNALSASTQNDTIAGLAANAYVKYFKRQDITRDSNYSQMCCNVVSASKFVNTINNHVNTKGVQGDSSIGIDTENLNQLTQLHDHYDPHVQNIKSYINATQHEIPQGLGSQIIVTPVDQAATLQSTLTAASRDTSTTTQQKTEHAVDVTSTP